MRYLKPGMIFLREEASAIAAAVTSDEIVVWLRDGREVHTPMSCSWRLMKAPASKRRRIEFLGGGMGLHWPAIDEDLSIDGLILDSTFIRNISGAHARTHTHDSTKHRGARSTRQGGRSSRD